MNSVPAKSIIIFRIGSLGDTLVAVPSMWAIRQHFSLAKITLLCDYHPKNNYVLAADVLVGSDIVDGFLSYPVAGDLVGRLLRPLGMLKLLLKLRRLKFDTLVYLVPSIRPKKHIARDRRFFRLAGIRDVTGMDRFFQFPTKMSGQPLEQAPREAELLLARIEASGVTIPTGEIRADLNIDDRAQVGVDRWLATQPSDGSRRWIAVGPGSKMPAKLWPRERYDQVVHSLIEKFDIWPVIFGGLEDRSIGNQLLQSWGRGYNTAGALGLRPSAAAIGRCAMYLGNDTGTMHLAAAAGVKCVAIFCSRDLPGLWYPIGDQHLVFRTQIDCECCMLVECIDRKMECIRRIETNQVLAACVQTLSHSK